MSFWVDAGTIALLRYKQYATLQSTTLNAEIFGELNVWYLFGLDQ